MLTYGLVRQRGPYAQDYPSSYDPSVRNSQNISPRYPYNPEIGNSVYNGSDWAKRKIVDGESYANPKLRKLQAENEMKMNEMQTFFSKLFGSNFAANLSKLPHTANPETSRAGPPPSGDEPPGEPTQPNQSMPNDAEPEEMEEEPEIKEEEEEVEEAALVPLENFPRSRWTGVTRAVSNIYNSVSTDVIQEMIGYMLPVVSHFLDTRRITIETGLRMLLGRQIGGVAINFIREDERLRSYITSAISDYAVQPPVEILRQFVQNPSQFLTIITDAAVESPGNVFQLALDSGGEMMEQLGQDIAQTIRVEGGNQGISIISTLLSYLQASSTNPRLLQSGFEQLAGTVSGPVAMVGGRTLRPRTSQGRAITGRVLRAIRRRTALG